MGKLTGTLITVLVSLFTAWLFWVPVRMFFISMIPASAEYDWVGKILITVMVAWFGGIGIPCAILIGGLYFTFVFDKS